MTSELVIYESGPWPLNNYTATPRSYSLQPRMPGSTYGEILLAELVLDALVLPIGRSAQPYRHWPTHSGVDFGSIYFDDIDTEIVEASKVTTRAPAMRANLLCSQSKFYILILHFDEEASSPRAIAIVDRAIAIVVRALPRPVSSHSEDDFNTIDNSLFERFSFARVGPQLARRDDLWARRIIKLV